eukprot:340226-Prorocentrum_minimum.AAC.1
MCIRDREARAPGGTRLTEAHPRKAAEEHKPVFETARPLGYGNCLTVLLSRCLAVTESGRGAQACL